jgi:hypothetical protein
MLVAGFAFEGSPVLGGRGVKVDFTRCQSAKIGLKDRYMTYRNEEGALKYYTEEDHLANPDAGYLKSRAFTPYMVETSVCGSNDGTSLKPKFSLKR